MVKDFTSITLFWGTKVKRKFCLSTVCNIDNSIFIHYLDVVGPKFFHHSLGFWLAVQDVSLILEDGYSDSLCKLICEACLQSFVWSSRNTWWISSILWQLLTSKRILYKTCCAPELCNCNRLEDFSWWFSSWKMLKVIMRYAVPMLMFDKENGAICFLEDLWNIFHSLLSLLVMGKK